MRASHPLMAAAAAGLLLAAAGKAVLLEGGARLQDPLLGGLALTPVLPLEPKAWLGLGVTAQGALRSDRLSAEVWNRYAGRRLEEKDKRALLADVGRTLDLRGQAEFSLVEGCMDLPGARRAGFRLEHVASAGQVLDARLLETALFGNDPTQSLVVERADVDLEVVQRLRTSWSSPLPTPWADQLGLAALEAGVGLFLEQGTFFSRTRSFEALAPAPQGEVSARLRHVQEIAGPGFGWGLDLGLLARREWAGHPLDLHAALRGLPHLQTWRQVRRETRLYELPPTPVDATFDYEAFDAELLDSTWSVASHDLHLSRDPGWLLAADWAARHWRHTVAWERIPEDARGAGRHRLAWTTRASLGPWFLRLQAARSTDNGPAWGAEGGYAGRIWQLALGGTGYAGLGEASRGGQLGVECRWLLP